MSDDRGRQLVRRNTPPASGRPSLERPSLFSGMEDDGVTPVADDQLQRVRILAALETARRNTTERGVRSRAAAVSARQWQTRVLLAVLLAGVVAVFTSFGLILLDRRAQASSMEAAIRDQVMPKVVATRDADTHDQANVPADDPSADAAPGQATGKAAGNPLAALIVPKTDTPPVVPAQPALSAAAIIEDVPPAAGPTPPPAMTAAPVAPVVSATPVARVAQPAKVVKTAPSTAAPTPRATRKPNADQDVALIEAMLVHNERKAGAAPRPAPAASSQGELTAALKQTCAAQHGAARATCRARFCVANPTASACHTDPGTP